MKKKILGIIALLVGFQLSAFSFQLSHSYALQLVPNVSGAGASEGYYYRISGNKALWTSLSAHQSSRVVRTAGNLTTTSSTFADATGMSITLTTGANPVLIGISGSGSHSVANGQCRVDIDIDGARQGQAGGLMRIATAVDYLSSISLVYQSATLTAASHTFKMQIATDQATATFQASTDQPLILWVTELK